jgi:hypothetical protein
MLTADAFSEPSVSSAAEPEFTSGEALDDVWREVRTPIR